LSFDYRARSGVEHTEILAPANAPEWVQDRAALWNAVEVAETRKNSQVAREIRVALPAELTPTERVELVREFCQREFVDRGMIADIAHHAPGREGDDRNHHAHIMLTTREIGPEGFTTKNRDWNSVEVLEGWREAWACDSNRALERSGLDERIDHRTLEAQRIEAQENAFAARERGDEAEELRETVRAVALDRNPTPQLSAGAWHMKERGVEVAAVRVWREVKEQAREVAKVASELAQHVRQWLERAVEAPEKGLAYAGNVKQPMTLHERLRAAYEAQQSHSNEDKQPQSQEPAQIGSLRDRLKASLEAFGGDGMKGQERGLTDRLERGRGTSQEQPERQPERTHDKTHERDDGFDL
jgi:ATP-dependent exoDNAse (exonuclease V) alpha subunit